jgi:DNA-binding beta-propeller fold protein YncE
MTPSHLKHGGAIWAGVLVVGVGLGLGLRLRPVVAVAAAQTRGAAQAPLFEVDPFWPKPLPNHWNLGAAVGVWVDAQDHVWMIHRGNNQDTIKGLEMKPPFSEICCATAPRVLEFDQAGNLLRHWGPGPGDPWMDQEHGIHIDYKNNVWLGGGGGGDAQILKYTADGKFLMQVGKKGARLRPGTTGPRINDANSLDPENFGQPTKIVVDAKTNEAYVSDGYVNHRVIVLDADTGKVKRMWGAYGNKPDDTPVLGPLNPHRGRENAAQPADRGAAHDPNAPPQQQFRNPVHCVVISKDDLVYVCDRQGDRLQVFTKDGKFVKEKLILPNTMNAGSVWDIALSSDPQQTFLYVADGENSLIHILRRDTLEILTAFGEGGRQPGQWHGVHNIATDSRGNIYTTETYEGKRIQKFTFKGVKPVTKPYQGTPWPASAR